MIYYCHGCRQNVTKEDFEAGGHAQLLGFNRYGEPELFWCGPIEEIVEIESAEK